MAERALQGARSALAETGRYLDCVVIVVDPSGARVRYASNQHEGVARSILYCAHANMVRKDIEGSMVVCRVR